MQVSESVQKAYQLALDSRLNAHAIYSKFKVGAALKVKDKDKYFGGCNVENASFGATNCAERTAVFSAVADGEKEFEFMVLVTDTDPVASPCGICRQVLSEFVAEDFKIYLANLQGVQKEFTLAQLLPEMFNKLEV